MALSEAIIRAHTWISAHSVVIRSISVSPSWGLAGFFRHHYYIELVVLPQLPRK